MAGRALILVLCILALGAASASAYEFKLLNGMKVEGRLMSFEDGRFYVDTEFGSVVIDADKLDYIIVEEADPGPSRTGGRGTPGIGLGREQAGAEKVDAAADGETSAPAPRPEPLPDGSIRPAPFMDRSVMPAPDKDLQPRPAPLGSFSVDAAKGYPGVFRGGGK